MSVWSPEFILLAKVCLVNDLNTNKYTYIIPVAIQLNQKFLRQLQRSPYKNPMLIRHIFGQIENPHFSFMQSIARNNYSKFYFNLFLVTAAMFFNRSKIPTRVLCRIPQGTFIPSLVPMIKQCQRRFLKEITLKIAKTSKKGDNSSMA